MQTQSVPPCCYEFYFQDVDTLIQVEASSASVIIRASRNTFGDQRKRRFIHGLAAEGFIPDDYEWYSLTDSGLSRGVHWRVDASWLKIDPEVTARTRRFMVRLIAGAALLWLVMMTVLFLQSRPMKMDFSRPVRQSTR
jgi:hypothetical protein